MGHVPALLVNFLVVAAASLSSVGCLQASFKKVYNDQVINGNITTELQFDIMDDCLLRYGYRNVCCWSYIRSRYIKSS